jgi:hypothetical protein
VARDRHTGPHIRKAINGNGLDDYTGRPVVRRLWIGQPPVSPCLTTTRVACIWLLDSYRAQRGGDCIQRQHLRTVFAALSSADDIDMNSRLRRQRALRDPQLLASMPYLGADTY